MRSIKVKVWVYDTAWQGIQLLSEVLLSYKKPGGIRHRLITGLFFLLLQTSAKADNNFIAALQNRRLRRLLRSAGKVPFWREYFAKNDFVVGGKVSVNDLQKLPPISKKNFIGVDRALCIQGFSYGSERILRHRTSGTTGEPFEWGIDKNVWLVEITAYFYRALSWYEGYRPFRWLNIATLVYRSYSVPSIEFFWSSVSAGAQEYFAHLLKELKKSGCSILFSYPTNLFLFAKTYEPSRDNFPLKVIVTTGQHLEDEYREYVEKKLGSRAVSLYGSREFGQMAIECPKHRHWYHLNAERLIVEVLDDKGQSVPVGQEGLITVTGLDNAVMPLIRYQLGDKGRFVMNQCSCGARLPTIEFFGREMDFIILSDGSRVPFRHIGLILLLEYSKEVSSYQIEQTHRNQLVVRYTTEKDAIVPEEQVRSRIQECVGESIEVVFVQGLQGDDLPGRKRRIFIPLSE